MLQRGHIAEAGPFLMSDRGPQSRYSCNRGASQEWSLHMEEEEVR